MKKITTTRQALLLKIQTLYYIEKQLEKALPKMAKASHDPDLKEGFRMHLAETVEHSKRLEEIFTILDETPKKLSCDGIQGIIEDAAVIMESEAPESLRDSMIAGAARTAEHYEMAWYLSAILQAESLGMEDIASLLQQTLREEESCDNSLAFAMTKNLELAENL